MYISANISTEIWERAGRVGGTRRVDVFPRWEELGSLAIRIVDTCLLATPRTVAPGEEDEEEFLKDVGVGDVEVVF